MHFAVWSVLLGLLFTNGQCCYNGQQTLYTAVSSLQTLSHFYYNNNENCWFNIQSPSWMSSSYYLEIQWKAFAIEGNMPNCNDYVEVFLTRSKKSIGKYCSGNIKSSVLFNMYSHDGYVFIKFVSDGSVIRSGFSLTYQLKSKSLAPLGGQPSSTCPKASRSAAGNFYSVGWPNGYASRSNPCIFSYKLGNNKMKIAVMDLDFYNSGHSCYYDNNYLEIKDSSSFYTDQNSVNYYTSSISGKLCYSVQPTSYTTTRSNVYFYYDSGRYGRNNNRGFVLGYIEYGSGTSWSSWSAPPTTRAWTRWSHWSRWGRPDIRLDSEGNGHVYNHWCIELAGLCLLLQYCSISVLLQRIAAIAQSIALEQAAQLI
ncbi:exoskeleton protein RP43-like [Rhopilema esculentum]|uniref:exoskeleton protein RP43-like n=1 Tax=Rhopilema esculentum TaxID=499914 RepID=UPI0031E3BFF5